MSYPPGSSRSCHEADGRSDRSGGSCGTGSGSGGGGNTYGRICGAFGEKVLRGSNPGPGMGSFPSTWQKWSSSFDALLSDGDGVALFKAYLESENCGNLLDFWFACQGFRNKVDPSDRKKILQLIKVIYQTYIRGSTCSASQQSAFASQAVGAPLQFSRHHASQHHEPVRLRPETRKAIAERLSHKSSLDQTIFDEAQSEIGHFLRNTAYSAFLNSDVYLSYIQTTGTYALNSSLIPPSQDTQASSAGHHHYHYVFDSFSAPACGLPTVDEDQELVSDKLSPDLKTSILHTAPMPQPFVYSPQQSYHYFGNPNAPPLAAQPPSISCFCSAQQRSYASPPAAGYYPSTPGVVCCIPAPAAPLTQENIQITRFQRAELPVPQHLSSCPRCHTPLPVNQIPPMAHSVGPQQYFLPPQSKHLQSITATTTPPAPISGPRKWVDAVCPKHEICLVGGLPRAPPNPYHVSYAPVSAQDSEHHSLSSGAHTDENISLPDGIHDDANTRLAILQQHRSSHHRSGMLPFPPAGVGAHLHSHHNHHDSQSSQQAYGSFPAVGAVPPATDSGVVATTAAAASYTEVTGLGVACRNGGAVQCRHQRRGFRKNPSGPAGVGSSGRALSAAIPEQNLAEVDPVAFSRLLTERLQRVLHDQTTMDRLNKLMSETVSEEHDANDRCQQQKQQQCFDRSRNAQPSTAVPPAGSSATTDHFQQASPHVQSPHPEHPAPSEIIEAMTALSIPEIPSSCPPQGADSSPVTEDAASQKPHDGSVSFLLRKPWADRLLAAARVQREEADNAQAILEDHCSRIWATSADRTPTSSGSGASRGVDNSVASAAAAAAERCEDDCEEGEGVSGECGGLTRPHLLEEPPLPPSSPLFLPQQQPRTTAAAPSSADLSSATGSASAFRHQTPISQSSSSHGNSLHRTAAAEDETSGRMRTISVATISTAATTIAAAASVSSLQPSSQQSGTFGGLIVGYYLCDDPVPYRSQWPDPEITLGQFKHLVPKKGPFRFFFKKASDEFDSGVVQQEISNDDATLPLWDGKVVAKVERIE
uniref:Axin-1 n=2 Tax=Schistocephalus solidus TaxID=70667 RepID=A0A0X3P1V7_SCHSO